MDERIFTSQYHSPLGSITIAAANNRLIGLWFNGQAHFGATLQGDFSEQKTPALEQAAHWLDLYFGGDIPNFTPQLDLRGTTFQREVWDILLEILYGETVSYGEIAKRIAKKHNISKMSARAVGSAVARNPISLIVPCHRVIGARGKLTGYAGGIDRKIKLLEIERSQITKSAPGIKLLNYAKIRND